MLFGSVCSGIEAASVAWEPLGFKAKFFSEIEPFPSAVLSHRFPEAPNLGDMTLIHNSETFKNGTTLDLLVGGTPCQSFSVAGLRKGLADPRGNLALEFLRLVTESRTRWFVWENVPGVLSSNGGRDFSSLLGALAVLGYGFAYRVLDAQYFGVPQRRRRVFLVGYLGDWRYPASVLFESESLPGNYPKGGKTGEEVTRPSGYGSSRSSELVPRIAGSLDTQCGGGKLTHQTLQNGHVIGTITARMFNALGARDVEEGALLPVAQTITARAENPIRAGKSPGLTNAIITGALPTSSQNGWIENKIPVPVAFQKNSRDEVRLMAGDGSIAGALTAEPGAKQQNYISERMEVRRLTPVECERLQGFPDNWTRIPYRKKPAELCPDGPRYKAIGNSMAVPCMRWIGQRILEVDNQIKQSQKEAR